MKDKLKKEDNDLNDIIRKYHLSEDLDILLVKASRQFKFFQGPLKKVGMDEEKIISVIKYLKTEE